MSHLDGLGLLTSAERSAAGMFRLPLLPLVMEHVCSIASEFGLHSVLLQSFCFSDFCVVIDVKMTLKSLKSSEFRMSESVESRVSAGV